MSHLVIGHGQLGSAVSAQLAGDVRIAQVPWDDDAAAGAAIEAQIAQFLTGSDPTSVAWCAGAGIVGSNEATLARERAVLQGALESISAHQRQPLRVFVASSAGGVYGGNLGTCDEHTTPVPISDYGRSKLLQEEIVETWAAGAGCDVMIGRISNLFGPRQNMTKPQGFVSHLLAAMLAQRPLVFTVPGSTIRDFVYADDVGRKIAAWLGAPSAEPAVTTKILAAERSMSLAHVTSVAARITRRSPRALFARGGHGQPAVIRFASRRPIAEVDAIDVRPFEVALSLTWSRMLQRSRDAR